MSLKSELQNIISGNGEVRYGKTIQTINHYLRREKKAIFGAEKAKFLKAQETKILLNFHRHFANQFQKNRISSGI
jgi:hypothetical protein